MTTTTNTSMAIIAIVVALALLGVVVIAALTIPLQQQAEAKVKPKGYAGRLVCYLRLFIVETSLSLVVSLRYNAKSNQFPTVYFLLCPLL
jgi:hypothetical protein